MLLVYVGTGSVIEAPSVIINVNNILLFTGSKEERDIYNHAGKTIQPTNTQYQSLKVKIKQVYAVLGSDFSVYFEIANYGFVDKDIHMVLSATAVTYSGAILKEFCKRSTKFMLKAASGNSTRRPVFPCWFIALKPLDSFIGLVC